MRQQRNRRSVFETSHQPAYQPTASKKSSQKVKPAPSLTVSLDLSVSTSNIQQSFDSSEIDISQSISTQTLSVSKDDNERYGFESQDHYPKPMPIAQIKKGLEQVYTKIKQSNTSEAQEIMHWIIRVSEPDHRLNLDDIIAIDQIFMNYSEILEKHQPYTFSVHGYALQ